ncbi:hypothetical protein [Tranquillimonas alkanivorans]|uniref:Tyr recombinase domain-containing protein n=1 Tax=Tranquillimonas alkanivorans TaxID=441119 RepID=A0A1I5VSP9_9RHOB|nr:hypothetical protein [Tranquillimonas alkanivorans]SFQ10624.1 hypothetical protein SAMN04488047_13522 [Tranquillimonas alkanivorans]
MTESRPDLTSLLARLRRHLRDTHPSLNRYEVLRVAGDFLAGRPDLAVIPDRGEATDYLQRLTLRAGPQAAQRDYSWFLMAAAEIWGARETAHLSHALRQARCRPKATRRTEWERAETAVAALPSAWRSPLQHHLVLCRDKPSRPRRADPWSASHLQGVARALAGWARFCADTGCDTLPTGTSLERYAATRLAGDVAMSSVADYLSRIYSGFATVLAPGFSCQGCEFVIDDWTRRGARGGTPTKTAAGILPASDIYELGFDLMTRATRRPFYGLHAARDYRNGLLLSVATSLPQRARALAALNLASTFQPVDAGTIRIHLPGRVLKLPERDKARQSYNATLHNARLCEALAEYRQYFRPSFDDGTALFPSVLAPGAAVSEQQIGRLVGNLTEKHLAVRVSVHRIRDCVATEASEEMPRGGRLAPVLLQHRDAATTERHYVHAEGLRAARDYGAFLATRRAPRPALAPL